MLEHTRPGTCHDLQPPRGFVLVPHGWEPGYQSQPVDSNGILDLTPSLNEGGVGVVGWGGMISNKMGTVNI